MNDLFKLKEISLWIYREKENDRQEGNDQFISSFVNIKIMARMLHTYAKVDRLPIDKLDYLLYTWEHDISVKETADALNLPEEAGKRAFKDFTSKNNATAHLRVMPYTLE